jgi:hypothetical protein
VAATVGGRSAIERTAGQPIVGSGPSGGHSGGRGVVWPLHHPPKAKSVIFLCLAGGPSHLETFDHKPVLAKLDGEPMPESVTAGQPIAQLQGKELRVLGPLRSFRRYGECGAEVSDYFPKLGSLADNLAIVRSMVTEQINHDPAHTFMNCGTALSGRPSMGAWVTYGLGSEADDLPGFVVMTSKLGRNPQPIAARQWHSGFLPGQFQGVEFATSGDPVHYVANPPGVSPAHQRDVIDTVAALENHRLSRVADPEVATRIRQYELAFRMQASVPDLVDLADEPQSTFDLYGTRGGDGSFAANCLLARRLAERVQAGELDAAAIDEASFAAELHTAGEVDPDLLIRTSGEHRISNFLLWQLAYAELHITDVLWPDFNAEALQAALQDYQGRNRRFGGVETPP